MREQGNFEQMQANFKEKTTTDEIGKVEDVVEGYLYLLKDKNITGMVVASNSGAHLV